MPDCRKHHVKSGSGAPSFYMKSVAFCTCPASPPIHAALLACAKERLPLVGRAGGGGGRHNRVTNDPRLNKEKRRERRKEDRIYKRELPLRMWATHLDWDSPQSFFLLICSIISNIPEEKKIGAVDFKVQVLQVVQGNGWRIWRACFLKGVGAASG